MIGPIIITGLDQFTVYSFTDAIPSLGVEFSTSQASQASGDVPMSESTSQASEDVSMSESTSQTSEDVSMTDSTNAEESSRKRKRDQEDEGISDQEYEGTSNQEDEAREGQEESSSTREQEDMLSMNTQLEETNAFYERALNSYEYIRTQYPYLEGEDRLREYYDILDIITEGMEIYNSSDDMVNTMVERYGSSNSQIQGARDYLTSFREVITNLGLYHDRLRRYLKF